MAGYIERPRARRVRVNVAKGELNKSQLAKRYKVSTKTIENWMKRRETILAKRNKTQDDIRQLSDLPPSPIRRSARHVRWKISDLEAYEARLSS